MKRSKIGFATMALAMTFFAPAVLAQKPPTPPTPPPNKPTQPEPANPWGLQPTQPSDRDDLVMFLRGRITTNDGTALPNDTVVERICNNKVRQQVYASLTGDFSMQMGTRFDSFVDASGSPVSEDGVTKKPALEGIPRRDLVSCELRASAAGFRTNTLTLMDLTPSLGAIDVGAIVVERIAKIKGTTVSATPYKAPPNARKAYEKGLEAGRNGKLAEARKNFEQALNIYPTYVSAWFRLGGVLEKENQTDAARAAYTRATTIDTRFLPPYLALAAMAADAGNWKEVLQYTGHIIDRDPLNRGQVAGYVLDLDEVTPAGAYFYDALANYKLNRIEEAENSAIRAERLDLRPDFPQLRLLLSEIFARKKDYSRAIVELKIYLELVPSPKERVVLREQLEKLEALNRAAPVSEKPVQN